MLGAPVAMTVNARGALSDRHPLAVQDLGVAELSANADVILVVGSRFVVRLPISKDVPTDVHLNLASPT